MSDSIHMGKIFISWERAQSGKDTIYRRLIGEKEFDFRTLVPYTTRPMRSGEENGKDYFFTDEAGLLKLQQEKR